MSGRGSGDGESSRCWLVERDGDGRVVAGLAPLPWDPATPAPGDSGVEAVITVEAAGFNYKDALACAGHPGVMRISPLVPGIDAAGTLRTAVAGLPAGAPVVVTANGLGETRHGGFATHLRVPATAVVPRPAGLSAHDAMALGTAGLTVLLAGDRLAALVHGPAAAGDAPWLVTGASGGVGMLAVACLARAGRRVVAATRKPAAAAILAGLGADAVIPAAEILNAGPKTLVKGRWAGVIDAVGGPLLAGVLKAVLPGGAVAAIGMAGGVELVTSVHPFILRGVSLAGIDAANMPSQAERQALWARLADLWPDVRDRFPVHTIGLAAVGGHASSMLEGAATGRAVVVPSSAPSPEAVRHEFRDRVMQPAQPRHAIRLADAWEPPALVDDGIRLDRHFGRPSGLEPGDRVVLAVVGPAVPAAVTVNGSPLPPIVATAARWEHDITPLLRERNHLALVIPATAAPIVAAAPAGAAGGRGRLPVAIGGVTIEIVAAC
jgi:acrylyl-CoA reductase (NADPH)